MEYTKDGLMRLSPEVVPTLVRDFYQRTIEGNLVDMLTEVEQRAIEDTGFRYFVDEVNRIFTLGGREESIPDAAIGYFIAYELFRRQAESNKLKRRR